MCQYLNEDLTLIRSFDSPEEAERITGIEADEIRKSCQKPKEYNIENQFLWLWEADKGKIVQIWRKRQAKKQEEKQRDQAIKPKKIMDQVPDSDDCFPVNQYTLDGEYIRTFENVPAARKAVPRANKLKGSMLQKSNSLKIYGGYKWRIDTGDHSGLQTSKRAVRQIDKKDRRVIATYASLQEAIKATGINHASISKSCHHPNLSAKGYYWEYIKDEGEAKQNQESGAISNTIPGITEQREEKRTMAKKSTYTEEQKAEILKRAAETSIANAAKEFDVSAVTISRWKAADKTTAVKIETKKKTRAAGRKAKEKAEEVKADVAEATKTAADAVTAAEIEVKKEARKTARKAKEKVETAAAEKKTRRAAKKADAAETAEAVKEVVEEKAEEVKAAAEEKAEETKKKTRAAGRKAKETVEKPVKKTAAKVKAAKMEIIVQSPFGHEISAEDIAAKFPKGTEKVYIRVDQNKLYWVGQDGTTGDVDIW